MVNCMSSAYIILTTAEPMATPAAVLAIFAIIPGCFGCCAIGAICAGGGAAGMVCRGGGGR